MIKTARVNQHFLVALLNSRLVRFWLRHRGKMQGQMYQVDKEPLLAIPLCVPSEPEQERMARLSRSVIRCLSLVAAAKTDGDKDRLQRQASEHEADFEALYGLDQADASLVSAFDKP